MFKLKPSIKIPVIQFLDNIVAENSELSFLVESSKKELNEQNWQYGKVNLSQPRKMFWWYYQHFLETFSQMTSSSTGPDGTRQALKRVLNYPHVFVPNEVL